MRPERWQQLDRIFEAALDRAPQERAVFLDEACAGDQTLRSEVELLLDSHEQADSFIEKPAIEEHAALIASQTAQLRRGDSVEHYRIVGPLGAGGMGEVYLALDTRLGRRVALKVLPAGLTDDRERLHRFRKEARAVSALNHPNIITIHEIGADGDTNFIATEFVEGETLRRRLRSARPATAGTLDVVTQIAAALDAAHRSGVVHRDIKPENVMLREDGLVKVLDFGLAKLTEKEGGARPGTHSAVETLPGAVMGTAAYMSPEQARGLDVDARTDIFSLGVVLHEMLAGSLPFAGETAGDQMAAILTAEPAPLDADTPAELRRIVGKALRKNADERYQTAKDLLADLKSVRRALDSTAEHERSGASSGDVASARQQGRSLDSATTAERGGAAVAKRRGAGLAVTLAALLLLTLAALGLGYRLVTRRAPPAAQIESLAVLPFVNQSGDADVEYLADGMTESLIDSLSRLPRLSVKARSTVFRYKGKEMEPRAVAAELSVQAVLSGRVAQRGDRLTLSLELVDARTGDHLWGERYSRNMSDLVSLQSEVARDVSRKLQARLSGADERRVTKNYTANTEAYQLYLKGRYYWNRRTAENLTKAIAEFRGATDRDPSYALAYVGLADCYALLAEYAGTPSSETLPQAKAFAARALEIDDSLAEAHASLGFINAQLWQWAEAEREFERAVELNPNYPTAHHWRCLHLRNMGRFDEAFAEIKRAQELDPLSSIINSNVAVGHMLRGDADSAAAQSKKIVELDPNDAIGHLWLGLAHLARGRNAEAEAEIQKVVELSERAGWSLGYLAYAAAVSGKRAEARALVKELEGKYAKREALGLDLAQVYAGLGDKDEAFAWLEKDFQARSGTLAYFRWYWQFDSLRGDPRYAGLLRRMNLPH